MYKLIAKLSNIHKKYNGEIKTENIYTFNKEVIDVIIDEAIHYYIFGL